MKKILMVLTSHSTMENTAGKTGVWLGEFTDPYYEFIDAGYTVTLSSQKGGRPPVDPMSELTENITGSNRRFQDDESAKNAFSQTTVLGLINAADYDAVFYPGGHGPIWDLAVDNNSGILIHNFLDAGKPVAAVCHGVAALINADLQRPGFLKGKTISAFSNTEESLVGRSGNVPYLLQTRLEELGAEVKTALIPFLSHVEKDGLLITGQNPLSAGPVAKALIELLDELPEQAAPHTETILVEDTLLAEEQQWQEMANKYLEAKPDDLKPEAATSDIGYTNANPGEIENAQRIGLPDKMTDVPGSNTKDMEGSLPSDSPFSQSRFSNATDLADNLEKDELKELKNGAKPGLPASN
ncbi:MAG: type 1 glutamine amidotransferase domain-containing protein [Pedobacter sp.]